MRRFLLAAAVGGLPCSEALANPQVTPEPVQETVSVTLPVTPRLDLSFTKRPLYFERNDGQVHPDVRFLARGRGYVLFLTDNEAVLSLAGGARTQPDWLPTGLLDGVESPPDMQPNREVLRMAYVGANPSPSVVGEELLRTRANYFIGNDPGAWRTNIETFGKVRLREIHPGVDLVYYGNEGELEYDFVLQPGADPNQITLRLDGADRVDIDPVTGDLLVALGEEEVRWRKPLVYQEIDGARHEVFGWYQVEQRPAENDRAGGMRFFVSFRCGTYDQQLALVIDPVLVYSTYLGGSAYMQDWDEGYAITADRSGNAYVAGVTESREFPVKEPLYSTWIGGGDIFVAKFSPAGELLFSSYFGGRGEDFAEGVAIDPEGACWILGMTSSYDFPTANPIQSTNAGKSDLCLFRINQDGNSVLFSTYFGGSDEEALAPAQIRIDPAGNVYIAGGARMDFPVQNAFQPEIGPKKDGLQPLDGFVTKIAPRGSGLVYSTYLGGTAHDSIRDLAVDGQGHVYVAGITYSSDFPVKNAPQPDLMGSDAYPSDFFYAKILPDGSDLVYASFFGGTGIDGDPSIALDGRGRLVLVASTSDEHTAGADGIVALFSAETGELVSSTGFGGSNHDSPSGIAVDPAGDIFVVGATSSQNFVTAQPLQHELNGIVDVFVTQFRGEDLSVVFSTFFGGIASESAKGIALDPQGNVIITGGTDSRSGFPLVNPVQRSMKGGRDAFVAKISLSAALRITRLGAVLAFSWPVSVDIYELESTTEFSAGGAWAKVPAAAVVVGDENVVTIEAAEAKCFYRLRKL